jgi:hypothetical protein
MIFFKNTFQIQNKNNLLRRLCEVFDLMSNITTHVAFSANILLGNLVCLEMSKVVPVPLPPGPNFFLTGTGIGTKMFFFDRNRDQNILDWDRHQNLFLKGPGPRPKTSFCRYRDQK